MKNIILVILLLCSMSLFAGRLSFAEEDRKSSWYIGFGIGTGEFKVDGETIDETKDELYADRIDVDAGDELAFKFGIGAIIYQKLHLGLDLSVVKQEVDTSYTGMILSDYDPPFVGDMDYESFSYQTTNLFAVLSYYPFSEGLYFKVGGGLSFLKYDYKRTIIRRYDISETFSGIGYLVGLGYDFRIKKSLMHICVNAEYSKQYYNDSDDEAYDGFFYSDSVGVDDTEFAAVYLTVYFY